MSSQYPPSQAWGSSSNEPSRQPNHQQQLNYGQGPWPQQYAPQQPSSAQQTFLNNNASRKPPNFTSAPPSAEQPSWNRVAQHPESFHPHMRPNSYPYVAQGVNQPAIPNSFSQNAIHSPQQYFPQDGYQPGGLQPPSYPPSGHPSLFNAYPTPPSHSTPPPMSHVTPSLHPRTSNPTPQPQSYNYAQRPTPPLQPPAAQRPVNDDHWGWGWDESSSDSTPASSTPNNNWASQTPSGQPHQPAYTSAQNYFQPGTLPPATGSTPPIFNQDPRTLSQLEPASETMTANTQNFSPGSSLKPENQSSHLASNAREVKKELISPDHRPIVASTPLTTQALRDFHKDTYSNGPSAHRPGNEGLTPQWSIESQMSQETVSDDASHSFAGGSDADQTPAWQDDSGSSQYKQENYSGEISSYNDPENSVSVRSDLYPDEETELRFATLRLNETDAENREVILQDQPRVIEPPSVPPNIPSYHTGLPRIEQTRSEKMDGESSPNPAVPPTVRPVTTDGQQHEPPFSSWPGPPPIGQPPADRPAQNQSPAATSSDNPYRSLAGRRFEPPKNSLNSSTNKSESQPSSPPVPPRPADSHSYLPQEVDEMTEKEIQPMSYGYQVEAPDTVNLETIPDNKERPDLDSRMALTNSSTHAPWLVGNPTSEVTLHGDRNQYMETEQLTNQYLDVELNDSISAEQDQGEGMPPPGLSRLVTGEGHNIDMANDISSPPAGLDRMVLGQITENDSTALVATSHGTPPPVGLDRMVLGQVTDEPSATRSIPTGPRLVPGESSSPETSLVVSAAEVDTRFIPGVASEDVAAVPLPLPASPGVRRPSPTPDRNQRQTERKETIGSESIAAVPSDSSSKHSKRRDKDYHREEVSSDERDSARRGRDGEYYRDRDRDHGRNRDRDRDESPGGDRRRVEWDRRRRHSPHRYRDHRDDRRRRRGYDYSDDEDADTGGYSSDRDRRNMSYRDDYDRMYPRREDRARSMRPEKTRDRPEDLRKEKKDKRRDFDRDPRAADYYRRRDDPEDYREQRSRPSSRNELSVPDFKQRGLSGRGETEPEHYRGHSKREREREFYYSQSSQYNYDPALYFYYQQYYENLRRTNPAAYSEYYRKFYASSQQGAYSEDRASVHSGRSSANDETKDRSLDTSLAPEEPTQPERLTPTKFTTAHARGVLTVRGQLIHVMPHYPQDGQPGIIEIFETLPCLQPLRTEVQNFPGPLIKNVTHKNNVVRFCKQKIRDADNNPDIFDKDSYKLIWEFFILLLRQNGQVVGTDIAELLISKSTDAEPLPAPSPATSNHSLNNDSPAHEDITNKYRDLLICGNTKEALEWAMKHGLWGHALFLASKMDQRTHASVMTRFANGLPLNDPLQTLYQLMSGRQPAAVTCCFDEKWGDWRPHLAMILSNASGREDVKNRAIVTLGDTLASRGALYAAHFCYLLAQVEFGSYGHKSSKIVLITSSHNQPFHLFATNEAIFATEIFEFALNLAGDFVLHHFQVYKLLMAQRLAEIGMCQEAVHYAEVIGNTILKQPSLYPPGLIQQVYNLGDMLKLSDPVYTSSDNAGEDPIWLQKLQSVLNDYQSGILQHQGFGGSISNLTTYSEPEGQPSLPVDVPDQRWNQIETYQPQTPQDNHLHGQYQSVPNSEQQHWRQESEQLHQLEQYAEQQSPQQIQPPSDVSGYGGSSTETPAYWTPPPAQSPWSPPEEANLSLPTPSGPTSDYFDANRSEAAPTITLPGSAPPRMRTTSQSSDASVRSRTASSAMPPRYEPQDLKNNQNKQQQQPEQGSGWFGGLWTKLSLRPKNQMILPDDKNPSIVWDPDKKRWVDQNGDEGPASGELPPPPTMMPRPVAPPTPSGPSPGLAPSASNPPSMPPSSGANLYKMPRSKNLRANYVDVMNPGSKAQQPSPLPAPDLFPSLNYQQQPKLFVPPPVEGSEGGLNLFTPSPVSTEPQDPRSEQPQGMSRWSSTSSLSREVQKYTSRAWPRTLRKNSFGPGELLPNGQWNNGSIGGTLPRTKRTYR